MALDIFRKYTVVIPVQRNIHGKFRVFLLWIRITTVLYINGIPYPFYQCVVLKRPIFNWNKGFTNLTLGLF
jgi:hypothetical protein